MTQQEMILKYMEDNRRITPQDAFMDLSITKLATRISELRREGYAICDEWVEDKNKFGQPVRYKRYWISGETA